MYQRTRSVRALALAVALVAVLAACGSEGSSSDSSSTTSAANGGTTPGSVPTGDTIAATMTLGGPPECPERPFCQVGLEQTYGLAFKDFKALDAGGPLTVAALQNGDIQVGLLFTTNGLIDANGWVLLEDDKNLQNAENVVPVVNEKIATEYGEGLQKALDGVSAKLTTKELAALNKQVDVDLQDAADVAKAWATTNDLLSPEDSSAKSGSPIIVGSADFGESEIIAEIYASVLEANGYNVEKKLRVGSREIYFPEVEQGGISLVPEYTSTLLTFLDSEAKASGDSDATYELLTGALEGRGVVAFAFAEAQDKNGFVVTKETADTYNLTKLSDLAKSAS